LCLSILSSFGDVQVLFEFNKQISAVKVVLYQLKLFMTFKVALLIVALNKDPAAII